MTNPSPLRPEAAVPSALDRCLREHEGDCLYLRAVSVRSEEQALSYCDCETGDARAELAALRERQRRLESALRELLEMSESDAADFDHQLAFDECMESARHQARKALGGDDART